MPLPQTNDKAIEAVFNDIYDASTGSVYLHTLYQATQSNRFSELVELLTFDSDESIAFSTRMQQVTRYLVTPLVLLMEWAVTKNSVLHKSQRLKN